jgi:hypothetical protein
MDILACAEQWIVPGYIAEGLKWLESRLLPRYQLWWIQKPLSRRENSMRTWIESEADIQVRACIDGHRSFAMIAGAGAGKTSSLVDALGRVRDNEGNILRKHGQRIACITFTKRAVEVIKKRLGFDELYLVSTLHGFLWGLISHFHENIRQALYESRIPNLIDKAREDDNGGNSKKALKARAKIERLTEQLALLEAVNHFDYSDTSFSDYEKGQIGHDDVIEIATYLLENNQTLRRIIGLRFPYIFVDEAQDTFEGIVSGLNLVCAGDELPMIGYFGDPGSRFMTEVPVILRHQTKVKSSRKLKIFAVLKALSDFSMLIVGMLSSMLLAKMLNVKVVLNFC